MHFFWRRHPLSPLILLIIFITSFGTALRHRIRHHRDRFKRQQGANLYLPGSYVFEDGEGPDAGPWTDWSSPSPCSRSCGGGVSTQQRQCQTGYPCQGPTVRHFSCNTQDCPDTGDFRAQQCSEFDSVPFEGISYQWVPYTKAPNSCELNCMPRGERFYYRHRAQVVDGTRCNDESLDVCVQGKCYPVGCDMMLGSYAKEDRCRKCGGDGSTCKTVTGTLDAQDFVNGYNDILLVPAGAVNIAVQETQPSNNYLAVRNTSGHYYLNGNWRIDFPRALDFAGCKFHYERYPQGFPAPDKITCLGPIEEPLFIVLLLQDVNVGVDYEYSIPTNIQPGSENETYAWTFDQFTPCSATCGGGTQSRNVTCVGRKSLEPVDRGLCDSNNEPAITQKCAEVPCEAQWVPYPWGNCSAPCGEGGVQTRDVSCQQIVSNGYSTIVDESTCSSSQPKPPQQQRCNEGRICAQWHTEHWKPCDHLCGEGKETRRVQCYRKEGSKVEVLDNAECAAIEAEPPTVRVCNLRPCEGVDWVASAWSGCDKCGLSNETRKVQCATASGEVFSDDLCEKEQKPEMVRQCETPNKTCEYLWYASQWSECSAECGEGVQTRTLFCGVVGEKGDVKKVENEKCDSKNTYDVIKNCTSEVTTCPGEWFGGPWTDCSKSCGGGEKMRKVICLKNSTVVPPEECDQAKIMYQTEDCNTNSCSEDTILPTDVTKAIDESETGATGEPDTSETEVPGDDEYEIVSDDECDDGEWVDEEDSEDSTKPMDELGSSTESSVTAESGQTAFSLDDVMLSDATTFSDSSDGTGSGDEELITPFGVSESSTTAVSGFSSDVSGSTELLGSTVEGSGDSSATEVSPFSDIFETDTVIEVDTSPSGSSESTGSSTLSSDHTDTTEVDSSEGVTETTTGISSSTDSSSESIDLSTGMESSSSTDASSSIDQSPTTGSSDAESSSSTETSESTPTTESTESSSLSSSTDVSSSTDSTYSVDMSSTTDSITTTESSIGTSSESGITESSTTMSASESSVDVSMPTNEPFIGESDLGSKVTTKKPSDSTDSSSESDGSITSTTESTENTESTEATTEFTGSSTTFSDINTDMSTSESTPDHTGTTESITEFTGSTETPDDQSTTEFTESVESSGTTETDIWATTESGATTDNISTSDLWGTTPIMEVFETKKPRMCKRRKGKDCKTTKFGCCWDNITPAEGPFDKGCPTPKTCKESKFGCCEDGVSPALGKKFKGCPPTFCNETLFGCCPDKKTPAEGNNDEGCPPPPPACLKSKYGCCKDNVTEAKGPKQKGCELETTEKPETKPGDCTNSTYGCCPDGTTTAEGPNYRGCKLPCSESPYGCCPDGVTPAHGYSREGCCLVNQYGCCPDNILPARGPNLEGCGCQYSPYQCCPDNKTAARGYNNEGCGCQHAEHGCCPDNYTPAAGPDYQGCLCHTFQFGCCPDGVTEAKGPHQQGCGCKNTEFGCCSDDNTPAQGPNFEGCGCDSSKFGCCPDGTTEASGEGFEGCKDIPVNLQDSCMLPKERGSCRNYTVKWFFDMDYGGCSRFWYGGCEGNGNRFKAKEECDNICVKPEGLERCNLPKISGPCEGYYPQWYYDKERKHCAQFVYGGCLGNNNRFETRDECVSLCVRDDSVDACEQKKDEGPCKGNYRRWYFDKERKSCQQFVYGGCKANNNNFPTEEACKQQCAQPGRKKDHCSLPRAKGNCTEKQPRWYHDTPEKRCLPFYYSGCNGNNNNFQSREECEADCPRDVEKDICQLPAETGTCGTYTQRWYYDTREKSCRQFYYGGCEGNGNNFETQEKCEQRCRSQPVTVTPPPAITARPEVPQAPFTPESCFLPSERGSCDNNQLRYYYDRSDGVCKGFTYGGCEGNGNNFETQEQCVQYCGNVQDLCGLPPIVGRCEGEYLQYYYDRRTDSCQVFNYGGCEGNSNRFQDQASCEQRCRRTRPEEPVQTQAPPVQTDPRQYAMCYEPADPGNCTDNHQIFFFDIATGTCQSFTYTGCGGNANRYNSEEQCERQCGQFRGQDVCNIPKETGDCRGYFIKYYYDRDVGRCGQFVWGGCGGNGNRFASNEECESVCLTHEEKKPNVSSTVICRLPVDAGTACDDGAYHKRWYFNEERGECNAFIYTGCGGNFNNFKTFQTCVDNCRDLLISVETQPPITDADHPCQKHFDECTTLRCPYGIEAYVDENSCNRCQCHEPCKKITCSGDTQCAIDLNRNRTSNQDPNFIAVCRSINKEGDCPFLQPSETNCEEECRNDADCVLDLKCCRAGCRSSCVEPNKQPIEVPAELVTQAYLPAYTDAPLENSPPKVDVETYEPEIQGLIGDHVTLHCAVTGSPTPRITWRKDNLIIDGTQAKYRIKLDQALQIITLHKTDSGIYLCTADNRVGEPLTNQIKLDVLDGPPRQASVLDQEEPAAVVSLNAPATINCLALGYPFPAVTWWKDDSLIPLKTSQFEVRKDYSLLIHSVKLSNLGIYTCQAYNGVGKAASWSVVVKAKGPYHSTNPNDEQYLKYIVDPPEVPATVAPPAPHYPYPYPVGPAYRPPPPPVNNEIPPIYSNDTAPPYEPERPERPGNYPVPAWVNITMDNQRFPVGGDISIPCKVDGFPLPQVQWYKDGVPLTSSDRVYISDMHVLTIQQATKADSGLYQCEAINSVSRASSTVQILVEGMYIDPNCKDNRFFANCPLIVKGNYCAHKYYARFCCRSCTEAGMLPADAYNSDRQTALRKNLV